MEHPFINKGFTRKSARKVAAILKERLTGYTIRDSKVYGSKYVVLAQSIHDGHVCYVFGPGGVVGPAMCTTGTARLRWQFVKNSDTDAKAKEAESLLRALLRRKNLTIQTDTRGLRNLPDVVGRIAHVITRLDTEDNAKFVMALYRTGRYLATVVNW